MTTVYITAVIIAGGYMEMARDIISDPVLSVIAVAAAVSGWAVVNRLFDN